MKRILHLDDDEEIIAILQYILGKNYTLFSTTDPGTAEDKVNGFRPDLVLTEHFGELLQPDSSLLQYARSSGIPIVLFSASPEIAAYAEKFGLNGYIEKPASIGYIREYVSRVLEG
ncbi:MAG: hypothetical protein DI535_26415 [Citrobacter freundii]|nr:MAG: hypothetical protein DI535_26415 [Citrobacter freundii]